MTCESAKESYEFTEGTAGLTVPHSAIVDLLSALGLAPKQVSQVTIGTDTKVHVTCWLYDSEGKHVQFPSDWEAVQRGEHPELNGAFMPAQYTLTYEITDWPDDRP